jgi:S1-C subfamily serine protease
MCGRGRLAVAGLSVALLAAFVGCARYPDLSGKSAEAQAWVKAERAAAPRPAPLYQRRDDQRTGEERGFVSYDHGKTWQSGSLPSAVQSAGQPAQRANPPSKPEQRPAVPEYTPPPRTRQSAATTVPSSPPPSKVSFVTGTCFAIDEKGTLATAYHLVKGRSEVGIRLQSGASVTARVVGGSSATDVAILKIDRATSDFLPIGGAHSARVGLPVFTIGFPELEDLGFAPKFTDGAVSSLSGLGDDAALMQITVPIQPGNSGGPLVNDRGEVVGVIISKAADMYFLKKEGVLPQNVNFATKAENLRASLPGEPAARKPTRSRQEAIDRAMKSVFLVWVPLSE